ncbi:MAG: hypothetical protein KJO41_05640 [Bacteroidia bacterium]|nr:hypothetical protein [Bacteroidia bacterium]MBT8278465.1 hypothetical protein [Bacteroidia bacterium]NND24608.1 hypothetical protein [Flavobacteriaceae bacterium]NNK61284.1 hypothetical protein [Flavobacteriaceae bacterium]
MKAMRLLIAAVLIFPIYTNLYGLRNSNSLYDQQITEILESLALEVTQIRNYYQILNAKAYSELVMINKKIASEISLENKVLNLIRKDQLRDIILKNSMAEETDISKIRYLKGLEVIKILYEKMVSLDHHFASMVTFNEINKISNPNHYPEFVALKDILQSKRIKKQGFGLSSLLGENVYTSVLHSFISLFTNSQESREDKEKAIASVECIFDFTLRMHNDLNTIYFETSFLEKSNEKIIDELEQLFDDYVDPIKYWVPLKDCRNNDDWDQIKENLNAYIKELNSMINQPSKQYQAHKMKINLEFPIDRLLQFIIQYNAFIDEGTKFYKKFDIMLNSYENEGICADKIPLEFKKMKENISISISKFNTAYKPIEINGSKMKAVLYGINDYD